MTKLAFLSISILLGFLACGQTSYDERLKELYNFTVPLISSDSLSEILDYQNILILDTRSKEEYQVSHLKGSRLIEYKNYDEDAFAQLPRDTPVVVYCSVGYRSEKVGEDLQKLGFSNVRNLYGGIFEWKNTEKVVVNQNNIPTDSVHTYNKSWSKWLQKGIKVYE